jgi:hypothetical protein
MRGAFPGCARQEPKDLAGREEEEIDFGALAALRGCLLEDRDRLSTELARGNRRGTLPPSWWRQTPWICMGFPLRTKPR